MTASVCGPKTSHCHGRRDDLYAAETRGDPWSFGHPRVCMRDSYQTRSCRNVITSRAIAFFHESSRRHGATSPRGCLSQTIHGRQSGHPSQARMWRVPGVGNDEASTRARSQKCRIPDRLQVCRALPKPCGVRSGGVAGAERRCGRLPAVRHVRALYLAVGSRAKHRRASAMCRCRGMCLKLIFDKAISYADAFKPWRTRRPMDAVRPT